MEALQRIYDDQKAKCEELYNGVNQDPNALPFVVIIMDDVLAFDDLRTNPQLGTILFNGRHYYMFFVVCVQYAKGLLPSHRQNFDVIALTYQVWSSTASSSAPRYM
jgi:hypothetical protein